MQNYFDLKSLKFITKTTTYLISIVLIYLAIKDIDIVSLFNLILNFDTASYIIILALSILSILFTNFRLNFFLNLIGMRLPFLIVSKANISGYLTGLVFLPIFGNIIGRSIYLNKYGISNETNSSIIIIEKFFLLIIGTFFFVIGLFYLFEFENYIKYFDINYLFLFLATITISILTLLFSLNKKYLKEVSNFLMKFFNDHRGYYLILITFLIQMSTLFAFTYLGNKLNPQINLMHIFAASCIISFLSSLPISVNGWGVRELSSIYFFGLLGIDQVKALSISLMIGSFSYLSIILFSFILLKQNPEKNLNFNNLIKIDVENKFKLISSWIGITMVCSFVFFQFKTTIYGHEINLNIADPFVLIVFGLTIFNFLKTGNLPKWKYKDINLTMTTIGLLLIIGFLIGYYDIGFSKWSFYNRLLGYIIILGYFVVGIYAYYYFGKKVLKYLFQVMILTIFVIISIDVFLRIMALIGIYKYNSNSIFFFDGFAGNRNAFGFQALIALSLFIGMRNLANRYYKNLKINTLKNISYLLIVEIILISGIILTFSKSTLITLFFIYFFSYFLGYYKLRELLKKMILISFIYIFLIILNNSIYFDLNHLLTFDLAETQLTKSRFSSPETIIERLQMYKLAFNLWWDNPFWGSGLGVFYDVSEVVLGKNFVIHSTPLWILTEFGIVGFFIFSVLLLRLCLWLHRSNPNSIGNRCLKLALVVFVVGSLFHDFFYQRVFWLVAGIALAKVHSYRKEGFEV